MTPLPRTASDEDLIAYVDKWAAFLEAEDYDGAIAFTDHEAAQGWTAPVMRQVIKGYGHANASQRVTVEGSPTDVHQRKKVTWWPSSCQAGIGEVWYDLNIDGFASDLTATFWIVEVSEGFVLKLNDVHVM